MRKNSIEAIINSLELPDLLPNLYGNQNNDPGIVIDLVKIGCRQSQVDFYSIKSHYPIHANSKPFSRFWIPELTAELFYTEFFREMKAKQITPYVLEGCLPGVTSFSVDTNPVVVDTILSEIDRRYKYRKYSRPSR